jgi:hypothetical protein
MNRDNTELTPSEVREYILNEGAVCPVCGEGDAEFCGRPESDDEVVYRDNRCGSCESLWVEYLTVAEVTIVEDNRRPTEDPSVTKVDHLAEIWRIPRPLAIDSLTLCTDS